MSWDELNTESKRAVVERLKEFKGTHPGEMLVEHMQAKRKEYVETCIVSSGHTGDNSEYLQKEALKASAKIELLDEIFNHETFGVTSK